VVKHTGPLLGYNNNVPYKGSVYHVQTEDSGSRRPHVITHLFADGGRIVKTKKTSYAQFVGADNLTERVRTLMRIQHKQMVLTLRGGDFDHLIEPPEGMDPRELAKDMVETHELEANAPILTDDTPSDDRDFQREMEAIAEGSPGGGEAAPARPEAAGSAKEGEKETTYKFVGRSGQPSKRRSGPAAAAGAAGRSSPPPARGRGGALPLTKRRSSRPPLGDQAAFGARLVTDRRFDELVEAFFSRS
jgi:hypothetical protein